MQREKRKHPRIEVGYPVTIMTPEVDIDGEIENISAGGAYIRAGCYYSRMTFLWWVFGIWADSLYG